MIQHSEQLDALGAALAKAQASVKGAKRDAANPFFKSSYADLASVWEACREALTSNGLSVVQFPGYADGHATLDTMLLHSSGQWISGTAGAPLGKNDAQGVGSALTYLRRYALAAVASVSPEDDDGNGASKKSERGGTSTASRPKAAAAPVSPAPTPPTAQELSEKPAALRGEEAMPWDTELKWKNKKLVDFVSEDLLALREFCQKKDAEKYAAYLSAIENILESRRGE